MAACRCGARRRWGSSGGEVLDLPALARRRFCQNRSTSLREVDRVAGRAAVVVARRVDAVTPSGRPGRRRQRQGQEHRGPEHRAVRSGVGAAHGRGSDPSSRQIRGTLAPLGGTSPTRSFRGQRLAAETRCRQLTLDVLDRLADRLGREPGIFRLGQRGLQVRPHSSSRARSARRSGSRSSTTGSSSRCQPCRHCCMRSSRARSAQGGHLLVDVAPQGTSTMADWPVSGSTWRSGTGWMHTPCDTATNSMTSRVRGRRARPFSETERVVSEVVSTSGCASMPSMLTHRRKTLRCPEAGAEPPLSVRECPWVAGCCHCLRYGEIHAARTFANSLTDSRASGIVTAMWTMGAAKASTRTSGAAG